MDIEKVKPKLLEEIKLAAAVDIGKLRTLLVPESPSAKHKLARIDRIVVIGASTGGPQTLTAILTSLPSNFYPPIIVIQHMPSREFTESLAGHLKHTCKLSVKVAEDNELITYKKIYLVPGGYSMRLKTTVKGRETEVVMRLTKDKPDDLTPSINATMRSAAELFDGNAIGVVLTGMGSDGVEGMQAIKDAGGATLAQDESSLIFGMPKAVIDRGCADSVLPAGRIASKIVELVSV